MLRSLPIRHLVLFSLLLSLGLAPPALAQQPARTVSDTAPLTPDGEVTVNNHEGSITITPWDRDDVQYEAQIMPTDEDPDAENTVIRVDQSDDLLRLATDHEEGDDESVVFGFDENGFRWGGVDIPAVHYTLKVPRTAALTIDDHESSIEVTGLTGRLRIDTHEGRVSVADHGHDVDIDSHDGPISVTNQQGDLTIDSHESRMDLRRVDGRLAVDMHDGTVIAEELAGGLRVDTHDGTVRASFAALSDAVWVDTHDGDVTLSVPAATGFDLRTDFSDDADVISDFDLRAIRILEDGDDDEVNYRGNVNGGGPEVYLESHDGDFSIRSH